MNKPRVNPLDRRLRRSIHDYFRFAAVLAGVLWLVCPTRAEEAPNPGFAAEMAAPESEVVQALNEVLDDHIIHGTHVFDREPTLTGAESSTSSPLFAPWQGKGKVFFKVRYEVIAPRHFKESTDLGTIAVRYIVTGLTPQRTRVRIEAVFVEAGHRVTHPSDGTVESSEYKVIQEHLQALQLAAQEAADIKRRRDSADLVRQTIIRRREDESALLTSTQSSVKELEERVKRLRQELERRVKAPGTDLKAAPFQASAKVQTLPAYSEVLVVIVTPHWYGVETSQGQRGWIAIDQLEPLP